MAKLIFFLAALAVLIAALLLFLAVPGNKEQKMNLAKLEANGHILTVTVADTIASRSQGLSGRERLSDSEGMFFIFPIPAIYPFWMKDMRFPIDIVWIRGEKIVGVTENASVPDSSGSLPIYSPPTIVDKVLEVNAGVARKLGLIEGGVVRVPD